MYLGHTLIDKIVQLHTDCFFPQDSHASDDYCCILDVASVLESQDWARINLSRLPDFRLYLNCHKHIYDRYL